MQFQTPLLHGKFIKRYKRFFVDVELDNGEVITAHCANTGSMKGLISDDFGAYVSHVDDPKRKLKYTLQMMELPQTLVGVNTSLPNQLIADAVKDGKVKELQGYAELKREVKYGSQNSRIDILLQDDNLPDCYIEVKNVTLGENNLAMFPDAVTTRGAKHLQELKEMVEQGKRAVMFYLVQRSDCKTFKPADDIDPTYSKLLREVAKSGVELLCYDCELSPNGIELRNQLTIEL